MRLPAYSRASFRKNLLGNSLASFTAKFAGLLFTLVAARFLPQSELGLLLIGIGVMTFCGTLLSLGLPSALNYYATIYLVRGQETKYKSLLGLSLKVAFTLSILFSLIVLSCAEVIAREIYQNSGIVIYVRYAAIGIPFFVLSAILVGVLRGYQKTTKAAFLESTVWRGMHLLLLLLIIAMNLEVSYLMLCIAIVPMLISASALRELKVDLIRVEISKKANVLSGFVSYSCNAWLISLANTLSSRADMVLLAVFVQSNEVAMFAVAATLSSLLLVTTNIIAPAFRPVATRLLAESRTTEFVFLYKSIVRINVLLIMPIAIYMGVNSEQIVVTVFGQEYRQSGAVLQILIWGVIPRVFFGPANPALLAMGRVRAVRNIDVVTSVLFVPLFILLSKWAGLYGAAVAIAVFGAVQHVLKNILVRKISSLPWAINFTFVFYCVVLIVLAFFLRFHLDSVLMFKQFSWAFLFPVFVFVALMLALTLRMLSLKEIKSTLSLVKGIKLKLIN